MSLRTFASLPEIIDRSDVGEVECNLGSRKTAKIFKRLFGVAIYVHSQTALLEIVALFA